MFIRVVLAGPARPQGQDIAVTILLFFLLAVASAGGIGGGGITGAALVQHSCHQLAHRGRQRLVMLLSNAETRARLGTLPCQARLSGKS